SSLHPHHLVLHSFPTRRSSDLTRRSTCSPVANGPATTSLPRSAGTRLPAAATTVPAADTHTNTASANRVDRIPDAPSQLARLARSEEHTSELQSRENLVCRLLL